MRWAVRGCVVIAVAAPLVDWFTPAVLLALAVMLVVPALVMLAPDSGGTR